MDRSLKKASYTYQNIRKAFKHIPHINIKAYYIILRSCALGISCYGDIFIAKNAIKSFKPLNTFYNGILGTISGRLYDTFIGDLYLFSNLNPIQDYFK